MDTQINEDDLRAIYNVMTFDLESEAEAERRVEVFIHFYGDRYDPHYKLMKELGPYCELGKQMPISADALLGSIVRASRWLEKESKEPIWIYLMDYIFSVLPAVDVRLYDVDVEKKPKIWLSGGSWQAPDILDT